MKIAFIFPKAKLRRGTRIKHFMAPPHSLQILCALTPKKHQTSITDEYHGLADPALKADLIGISVWTASSKRAYELADHYRRRKIPIVLGGPHVTVCPEEAASHADSIVVGEAEAVWAQVVADAEAGRMKPHYHGRMLPLEKTPAPDWSIIHPDDYFIQRSLSTTRGCVRRCDFCYESSQPKSKFRQRPIEQVLREIDSRPGPVTSFLDNDIAVSKQYARTLFTALKSRKINWIGMTSIETARDEEMLDLMAESGCRTLFVGFESIVADSLREVHKHCNQVEDYVSNVRRIQERGIMVSGGFVFGFDHDDPDIFERTVRFGIEARLETATFTVLTPYPGTTIYKRLLSEGRIFDHDWSHYNTTRCVFHPKRMSAAELESGYFRAYKQFYSWPSILRRCRPGEPGFSKKVFLNTAYKHLEPLYGLLCGRIRVGRLRRMFNYYASPYRSHKGSSNAAQLQSGNAKRGQATSGPTGGFTR